ncbi:hypothetical protein NMG60_11005104 [Bertholletia excelsa]
MPSLQYSEFSSDHNRVLTLPRDAITLCLNANGEDAGRMERMNFKSGKGSLE